jgi:hypothetical protein
MQASAQRAIGSGVAPGTVASRTNAPRTTRKRHAPETSYVAAPGARERRSSKAANPAPGSPGPSCCSPCMTAGVRLASRRRPTSQAPQKVTGNESVRRFVEGVRAAAARCGPLRTGATGLEPATSGVTERGSAAQSPRKHAGWELERSPCRHLFADRSRPLRAAGAANPTRPSLDRGHTGVILLWGSDRLITAVRVHDRRPGSSAASSSSGGLARFAGRVRVDAVVVWVISYPAARRP